MLDGMKPINNLPPIRTNFLRYVPNPRCAIPKYRSLFRRRQFVSDSQRPFPGISHDCPRDVWPELVERLRRLNQQMLVGLDCEVNCPFSSAALRLAAV